MNGMQTSWYKCSKTLTAAATLSTIAVFFALIALVSVPATASAQITPDFTSGDNSSADTSNMSLPEKYPQIEEQLDISVEPDVPKPGDEVTVTVQSYGMDLNTQLLTWKINGVEKLKGVGQKKFTFTLGDAGSVSIVQLTITTASGFQISKSLDFSPVNVDVIWQANTYTPPFYKGKALYTPEANVTFVAMPNIISGSKRVDPSNVVYTWKLNYEVQGSLSGFGRNTFDFTGPIFIRPSTIEASAYAAENAALKGSSKVTVTPENPLALVYEDNPLLGVLFNKEIGAEFPLRQNEVKVAAYPFFFSTSNKNSKVDYNWSLNTNPVGGLPSTQNNLTLRRTDSSAGQSLVSLYIGNDSKILQEAAAAFAVTYGDLNIFNPNN